MSNKPMPLKKFESLLKIQGWNLIKGGIDYKLYDDNGHYRCTIKITHGKNTKGNEVDARSIRNTEKNFKEDGLTWPPKKK
jgi:hypothetical protein